MLAERVSAIIEELEEVESLQELEAIVRHWEAECPEAAREQRFKPYVEEARNRVSSAPVPPAVDIKDQLARIMKELKQMQPQTKVVRGVAQYRLLKKEITWTTKPQVHTIMAILTAHMDVGDVLDEDTIIEMMEANVEALNTRQGGKRIWDYYKGDHPQGLVAHGNIERA